MMTCTDLHGESCGLLSETLRALHHKQDSPAVLNGAWAHPPVPVLCCPLQPQPSTAPLPCITNASAKHNTRSSVLI